MKKKMYLFVISFIIISNGNLFCQSFIYNNQLYTFPGDFGDIDININGNIVLKQFYGPPGYGETPKIDSVELFYVLILDKPIMVSSEGETFAVKEIQLSLDEKIKRNFSNNKDYIIKGKAFFWHTIHHRTPIVISVDEIFEITPK
jgi:hypothetical protein